VIHVDVPALLDLNDLAYKLNRILDTDIRITNVSVAPEAFHARFSALRRHYTYKILDENKVVPPLDRFDVASWYRPLDIDLMNKASALVLGQHDFAAFAKFREGATTIRELQRFEWVRDERGYLIADVVADAFCYSMVRNLVGATVCVGDGRFPPEWIVTTLINKVRISDSLVFPALGLTLRQVDYPSDSELLERAQKTVARRDLLDAN
jgi:tRNA pseudouridine38-40 synthase